MEYKLKNGKTVSIRKPVVDDAQAIINLISTADTETKFLARNPGEFCTTADEEKTCIRSTLDNDNNEWFIAEYENEIAGMCSIGLVSPNERFRHRAEVTFVILKKYWNMGIGGKLMLQCIDWCKNKNVTQIELEVVSDNERAISLYESFGFKTTGIIPKAMRYADGTFADKKLMILEL